MESRWPRSGLLPGAEPGGMPLAWFSDTLAPSDGETEGVRGRFPGSQALRGFMCGRGTDEAWVQGGGESFQGSKRTSLRILSTTSWIRAARASAGRLRSTCRVAYPRLSSLKSFESVMSMTNVPASK